MDTTTPTDKENTSFQVPATSLIAFHPAGVEVLRIDKDGMVYKGKRIEDAGEAHRAFLEVMAECTASLRAQRGAL